MQLLKPTEGENLEGVSLHRAIQSDLATLRSLQDAWREQNTALVVRIEKALERSGRALVLVAAAWAGIGVALTGTLFWLAQRSV